jgi:cobalt-precorrin-5B (C1)-methyltransferase
VSEAPVKKKGMRTGFTTGACAAAAAKAATAALLTGRKVSEVEIGLPISLRVKFAVRSCEISGASAVCSVVKDAGDDPDCTHGAEIVAEVRVTNGGAVEIEGGEGVARVTKAGLGIEVGRASITKTPLKMIAESVREALAQHGRSPQGAKVLITVPRGLEMAKKTLNERLGLIGGISILGKTGIVRPYSTAAFKVSIAQGINVAQAAGVQAVVLTTGGESEKFAMMILPDLPEEAFVQMGDFLGWTLQYCRKGKVPRAIIVGMIGKLSKMASGMMQTHARRGSVDLTLLADLAAQCGAPSEMREKIRGANTAREVQEIVVEAGLPGFFDRVCQLVCDRCSSHTQGEIPIEAVLTDFEGKVLGRALSS